MSNRVLLKKSSVSAKAPLSTDLEYGEVALNYQDGKLYFKTAGNNVEHFDSRTIVAQKKQEYTATASQTTFTVTGGYVLTTVQVFANGIALAYSDYTATNGTTVVLTDPRVAGDNIIIWFGGPASGGANGSFTQIDRKSYIATSGQTTFNVTYAGAYVDVYINGSHLNLLDYTATSGTNIVLNSGATVNDEIDLVGYYGTVVSSSVINNGDVLIYNGTTKIWDSLAPSAITTASAAKWSTARTLSYTGDATGSMSVDGSTNVSAALTLATVNSNVGSFGSTTASPIITVNAKGLVTAVSTSTITPAIGSITGLGTNVATALGVNTGTAGAFVVNGDALGTPASGVMTNVTGTAAGLTAGNVTTNANLTGVITSTGNATAIADAALSIAKTSGLQAAIDLKQNLSSKDAANGYAGLDSSSKINPSQLPALAITDTFVVASQAAQIALTAEVGDVAIRTDLSKSFILQTSPSSTFANWQELLTPTDSVSSVFGRTGVVTAQNGDYTAAQVGAPAGSGNSTGTNTGDQTNISGNAATVTTNANLTGPVTSVGNATSFTSGMTIPAFTLGGTVSGGGNQINNVVIGTTTPLAGAFTTLSASGTITASNGNALTVPNGYQTLYRTTNDASSLAHLLFYRGTGAGAFAGIYTIGDGANGVASLNLNFNGTDIAKVSSTGLAVTGTLSTTGSIQGQASAAFKTNSNSGQYYHFDNATGNNFIGLDSANTVRLYAGGALSSSFTSTGLAVTGTVSSLTSSAVQPILSVQSTGADSYPSIRIINDARTWQMYVDGTTADKFKIFDVTANEPRLIIDSSGTVSGGTSGTGFSFSGSAPATSLTLTSGGNLGIGTSSPSVKFQTVQTIADWTGDFKNYTAGAYGLRVDLSGSSGVQAALQVYTATGNGIIVKNDGLVGIGTFSPANKLTVADNSASALFYGTQSGAGDLFAVANSASEKFRITNAGNVGIGTSSPDAKLDVYGTIRTTIIDSSYYADTTYLGQTYNFGSGEITDGVSFKIAGASASTTGNYFSFWTQPGNVSPIERMRINKHGQVLIGTTSTPYSGATGTGVYINGVSDNQTDLASLFVSGAKIGFAGIQSLIQNQLTVYDSTASNPVGSGGAIAFGGNAGGGQATFYAAIESRKDNGTAGAYGASLNFYTRPDAGYYTSPNMTISSAGNVGIGTTSPGYRLEVVGTDGTAGATSTVLRLLGNIGGVNKSGGLFFRTLNSTTTGTERIAIIQSADVDNNTRILALNPTGGDVGIGTTSPTKRLEVKGTTTGSAIRASITDGQGSASFGYGFYVDNTAQEIAQILANYVSSGGAGYGGLTFNVANNGLYSAMTIDYTGKVGIGTTNPQYKLEVVSAAGDDSPFTVRRNDWQVGEVRLNLALQYAVSGYISSGITEYVTDTGYIALNYKSGISTYAEGLRVSNTGKVGIGTSSPGAKLDVAGSAYIRGDSTNATFTAPGQLAIKRSSGDPVFSFHGNTGTQIGNIQFQDAGTCTIGVNVNQALAFNTNSTERMRITADGNILLGTTSDQGMRLVVYASSYTDGINVSNFTDSTILLIPKAANAPMLTSGGASQNLTFGINSIEKMRITSTGNVGIGTTTPTEKLQISGVSSGSGAHGPRINILYTGTSGSAESLVNFLDFRGVTNAAIGNNLEDDGVGTAAAHLVFKTALGGTLYERMRINSSGNLTNTRSIATAFSGTNSATWTNGVTLHNSATAAAGNASLINFTGPSNVNAVYGVVQAASGYGDFVWAGYAGSFTEKMRLDASGNLTIPGTFQASALVETSSIALKENVEPITGALDLVNKLMGKIYDRRDNGTKQESGLIAEEVFVTAPNLVSLDEDGKPVGVKYTKIIAYLIESIKELSEEITKLKGK